ncbi:putative plant self-incompatibility S1 [Lupinus albus]|uniref:S-protein homolog n=1 Tax=Lupinus albus TaxID=3870 RepID=A0A6A4QGA5_LUPAL|nr:putative plant self-incompatibility S1 [Lupinus albus]
MAALFVKKNVLPLMLVTVYLTLQMMVGVETVDIGIAKDTSVTMFNNISQQPLTIHCQEKGYDDGFHNVSPGESYCINVGILKFVNKSLWFCSFNWTGAFHSFDIFVQKRDKGCTNHGCVWNIKKEGPCKIGGDCYPWTK